MSAASSATTSPTVNISAFIMMHGVVYPIPLRNEEYKLTGASLPPNTRLFAPVILGHAYYDHTDSNQFIRKIHEEYLKMPDGKRPDNYINYCLDRIREFEKEDVAMCEKKMAASSAMFYPTEQQARKERKKRLDMLETVAHKSCVEWCEHEHFIEQKTYSIHDCETPPNSIMFFCQEDGRPKAIDQEFKDRFDRHTGSHEFERKISGRSIGTPDKIDYNCACDLTSQICSIKFTNRGDVHLIPFHTLYTLLLDVVSKVYHIDQTKIHVSFFDFTCDELGFPGDYHEVDGNFRPVFISSNKRDKTLVYGTIGKEIAEMMDDKYTGEFPWAQCGSPSPQPPDARLRLRPEDAAAIAPFDSPDVPPTPTLTVHLSRKVMSFVDFVSKFEDRSRSVSPDRPEEVDGGSHRTHTRRLRHRTHTRRHPRVGKKVSLRHGRRLRRDHHGRTNSRSTRSIRKRKTTK